MSTPLAELLERALRVLPSHFAFNWCTCRGVREAALERAYAYGVPRPAADIPIRSWLAGKHGDYVHGLFDQITWELARRRKNGEHTWGVVDPLTDDRVRRAVAS